MLLAVLAPARASAAWVGAAVDLMGTRVSVELWDEDEVEGHELVERVLALYRHIDDDMSTYKPDSEISRINREAFERPVVVSAELYALIARALDLSALSGGAFDITYESVGYLYDFHAHRHPSAAELEAGVKRIDYRLVELDPATFSVHFAREGVRINLGGIAKGYAVEQAAALLSANGIEHAVLNAGGDTRVLGDRRGSPWIVGIRHPRAADASEVITRLPLVNEAISTSGDYERFFEEGGRRYHHIINPSTGEPTEGILSATVIGPDATMTDGLSTTMFVLGVEAGLALIERVPSYEAVLVSANGKISYSSGLAPPAG